MAHRVARLRITGRVQGVGYRAWAVAAAERRGLRGWVRNRRDGSVEMLVAGDATAVCGMIDACREGPFSADVSEVTVAAAEDDGSRGFLPLATA